MPEETIEARLDRLEKAIKAIIAMMESSAAPIGAAEAATLLAVLNGQT